MGQVVARLGPPNVFNITQKPRGCTFTARLPVVVSIDRRQDRFGFHNRGMAQSRFRTRQSYRADRKTRQLPYRRRGPLLTQGEAAFYRVLLLAIGRRYHVAFKARLADLVTCSEKAWESGFGHMIARHHVDFALCDYRTMDVVAVIELDDRSHARKCRRRRDRFLGEVLEAAGIPLVRIRAASRYGAGEVAESIASAANN